MPDSPDITIVVPTYWGRAQGEPAQPGDLIFDHPTPADGESTLPRLLDSLYAVDADSPPFDVLILVATVHPGLDAGIRARLQRLLAPYRAAPFAIRLWGRSELDAWRAALPTAFREVIGLDNYARIRNNQLLVPHVMDRQVVIALDDDEIVPPDYAKQALRVEQPGVAGFYEDADGSVLLPEQPPTGNPYLDKATIMNDAARTLLAAEGDSVPTVVAFGGNMVFRRDLWRKVPFDPGITRGEDIDYVLNARLAGYTFWLDKHLRITHLPPHHYDTPPYIKMAEDVRRFVYERHKLALQDDAIISQADLDPYPGQLIAATPEQIIAALEHTYDPALPEAPVPAAVLDRAREHARTHAPAYDRFRQRWQAFLDHVEQNADLRARLTAVFRQ